MMLNSKDNNSCCYSKGRLLDHLFALAIKAASFLNDGNQPYTMAPNHLKRYSGKRVNAHIKAKKNASVKMRLMIL